MSERFLYKSSLARFMREFVDLKEAAGIVALRTKWILLEIDKYYVSEGIEEPVVTSQIVAGWRKTRTNDSDRTLYAKYSVWNQLTRFMSRQGHECYIPPLPQYRNTARGFTPYIFSHAEIKSMMAKADGLRLYDLHMSCGLMYIPALLRLLYSTGLRISEAISVRNEDVNFGEGHIIIRKSKNGSERLLPLGKPMADVLRQYVGHRNRMPVRGVADPSSFLFVKTDGTPGSAGNVYKWFRRILQECGIPFMGDHKGPRVHDLRHTFAVHALVHMARNGMDLYTSMPILSTCLGHRSLSATEQYVRLTMEMYPELVEKTKPVNTFVYPIIKNDKLHED